MFLTFSLGDIVQSAQHLGGKQYQQAEAQHDGNKPKIGENTDSHVISFYLVLKPEPLLLPDSGSLMLFDSSCSCAILLANHSV